MTGSMDLMAEQDWYAYLRLSPDAATEEIEHAVERLSRQASAMAVTAPERSQLLRETIRAIKRDLLSGADSGQRRHPPVPAPATSAPPAGPPPALAANAQPAPPGPAAPAASSRLARFLRTGWTCPECGKEAIPSDKFCTRCGSAIQAFRPAADRTPSSRPACAACANPLGTQDVFCSKCGTRR